MNSIKPDNSKLTALLNAWAKDMSKDNYGRVRKELMEGNSFLMLPSGESGDAVEGWKKVAEGTKIQLASLYTVKGVKTLGVFTDVDSVLRWSKGKPMYCNSFNSETVFEICERNGIKRIVINSGSENIFPLDYYTEGEIEPGEEIW